MKRKILFLVLGLAGLGTAGGVWAIQVIQSTPSEVKSPSVAEVGAEVEGEKEEIKICDGKKIIESCRDEAGVKYIKYIYHEAVDEVTKTIHHPEEPAKTHTEYHEPVYGTRQVQDCVRVTITNKKGQCALSQCRDGEYSGSIGRGTCSYHGGVLRSGGPWYEYYEERYLVSEGWTETIVDKEAVPAWDEIKVVTPAKEAYFEKIPA